ncbi:MAG TPA: ATP-grasp fold amidoligase family protein [Steroidobacteraceae bacterium]|nr:ATP-grasp fold amidoligase family protein [Steroidobacteraceae bacterium]
MSMTMNDQTQGGLFYRALDLAWPRLRRLLPYTESGDRLFHRLNFMRRHRRAPNGKMLWNDVWYRVKTTEEILEPLRVFVSDKEHVKQFVKAELGDEYNVPTLAVLRSPAEVDRYDFPADCCIKPTQASGKVILRKDGAPIDRDRIKRWFDINYYFAGREWNYRALKPKVIVEPLIFGGTNVEDFKIFCFNGEPKLIQVDIDRYIDHTRKFFDTDWREQDFSILYPRSTADFPRPASLDKMLAAARKLAAPFSFVRIDLYSDGDKVLVGEITNCSENAGGVFVPPSAEQRASALMFG